MSSGDNNLYSEMDNQSEASAPATQLSRSNLNNVTLIDNDLYQ